MNQLSPIECLYKAIENQFSTKSTPRNKGLGLHTVINNVNSLKGKILIISGRALYMSFPDGRIETKELIENFPGCLIVIYLNTDYLLAKEEEQSDELHLI
jgi:hypothetical protein